MKEKKKKQKTRKKKKKINNEYIYNKNIDIVRFNNENIINDKNGLNSEKEIKANLNCIDNLFKSSSKNYVSPSKILQEKVCLNKITLKKSFYKRKTN